MKLNFIKNYFFALLLIGGSNFAVAQKNIAISDSLSANADVYKVKMGSSFFGKMQKYKFGEYVVLSGKVGWAKSSSSSNFLDTKTESKSSQKFSFVLANGGTDTAKVNAARNTQIQTHNGFRIFDNFTWGDDETLRASMNFSAFISLNSDTSVSWALIMKDEAGTQTPSKYSAVLTDGQRRIQIFPVYSNGSSNSFTPPAMGYEFFEIGNSYAAVQYFGGGMFPQNRNMVWLNKKLEPKMKLVLSAAMVAIIELKFEELQQK